MPEPADRWIGTVFAANNKGGCVVSAPAALRQGAIAENLRSVKLIETLSGPPEYRRIFATGMTECG
jgi:hypothetical protein